MSSNRTPFLIALEGPAGVGKTTLQNSLCQALVSKGINAAPLPEFSDSPLGKLLRASSGYREAKPSWTVEAGGLLAFLADKVRLIEATSGLPTSVWISDRFVSSQLILGLREISSDDERQFGKRIISETTEWASDQFAEGSLLVLLEAPIEVLVERIEKRVGGTLLETQRKLLDEELREYGSLELSLPRFKQVRVDANDSIETVANQIISLIPSQWAH